MAPMKRQRSILDDGQTQIVDVGRSAQLKLQQASRKKSRVSYGDLDISNSEDISGDDESFLEQATQFATQQKTKPHVQNQPADNGIIESVTCSNFMCHAHLEIVLGPLINFIIGPNGSGKSAVLTALTICLGGKASATNRGQSLKSFIKEGQEYIVRYVHFVQIADPFRSAMLSVKIKNRGETAYQQDIFGNSIIVERHFSRSGSSSFKLKAFSGRLISTRRSDLEEICDFFALQIDNPMNVLNQDMARQFLNSSSPQEKYRFFMKGTQLEHLDGDYLIVEQNLDAIDTELCKKQQDCDIYNDRAEKADHLLRLSQQQDLLRDKIDFYRRQLVWVQVEEQERVLADMNKGLQRGNEKIASLEMKVDRFSEAFSQTEQAAEHAKRGLENARDGLKPLAEQKAIVKAEHDKQKAEQTSLQSQHREIVGEVRGAKARIVSIMNEIQEEHRRLSDADGGKNAERRQQIEEKKEAALQAKSDLNNHEEELPGLELCRERATDEYLKAQNEVKKLRVSKQQAENRLKNLVKDSGQQQSAYHPSMPRLLRAIQQDDGFREKPVGPIGRHIRLLKPEWSSVLEKSLGSSLDSFIVTSKQDQTMLAALMKNLNCSSPILIGKNHQIDTTAHEPEERFETSMRVLEIDNDIVRNSLIINQSIEQTILIADRKEAIALMNEARIPNVKQCFCHNIKPGSGARIGYGFGSHLSETYIYPFEGTPRMKTDIEYQISVQRQVVDKLNSELSGLDRHQQEKRDYLVQCERAIVSHKERRETKRYVSQEAQNLVEEMQDALDADAIEEGRLDTLKAQLAEAEEDKLTYEGSYGEVVLAKDAIFEAMRKTRERMAELDKKMKDCEEKIRKAEDNSDQRLIEQRAAMQEKNAAIESADEEKEEKAKRLESIQGQTELVEDFRHKANEICIRVSIERGETQASLTRKFKKLQRDLEIAEKKIGDRSAIVWNSYQAKEALHRAHEEVESIERLAQVEPDETRRSGNGRNTHGLSGGEKSFSTICLLLAIWEAMGAPIRALDEFDVFMDSVNREVSMQMMIQFARNSPGKQFILISPQSTNINLPDRDVKIIKMSDPERGQKTLKL
ncbi:MAG: hypothetical protein Q9163_002558 [Psora crenata]